MSREIIPQRMRFLVLERDDFSCRYCGAKAPDVVLHVDHVIPVSKGGPTHPDNLVSACADCNCGKGAMLLGEPEDIRLSAELAYDRGALVRSLVLAANTTTFSGGDPTNAPQEVVLQVKSTGQAVAVSLEAAGVPQAFLAGALGISPGYVSLLVADKRPMPQKFVGPICAATGTNLLAQYVAYSEASEVSRLAELMRRAA